MYSLQHYFISLWIFLKSLISAKIAFPTLLYTSLSIFSILNTNPVAPNGSLGLYCSQNRDPVTLIVYNCQSSLVNDNNLISQFTLIICKSAPFSTPIEQKQCTIKEISALFSQLHNFSCKKTDLYRSLLFYCTILLAVSIFIWTTDCGSLKFKCIGAEKKCKNRDPWNKMSSRVKHRDNRSFFSIKKSHNRMV